jgi:hypothetical protein
MRSLLGRPVVGPQQQHLGHVRDLVAQRLPDPAPTTVTGLILDVGGWEMFTPVTAIRQWHGPRVIVHALPLRRQPSRHPVEFPLVSSTMRKPVMVDSGTVHRVGDIGFRRTAAGWVVWAADTRNAVARFLGLSRRLVEWDVLMGRRLTFGPAAKGQQSKRIASAIARD